MAIPVIPRIGSSVLGGEMSDARMVKNILAEYARPKPINRRSESAVLSALHRTSSQKEGGINEAYEFILARTKAYKVATRGMDPQFIPYASSWFNQSRFNNFEDYQTTVNTVYKEKRYEKSNEGTSDSEPEIDYARKWK